MGLMSVAKPMIQNVFTDAMPLLVTPVFASGYLMAMAAGNLGGRLGWAAVSDKIGRWNTFQVTKHNILNSDKTSPELIDYTKKV